MIPIMQEKCLAHWNCWVLQYPSLDSECLARNGSSWNTTQSPGPEGTLKYRKRTGVHGLEQCFLWQYRTLTFIFCLHLKLLVGSLFLGTVGFSFIYLSSSSGNMGAVMMESVWSYWSSRSRTPNGDVSCRTAFHWISWRGFAVELGSQPRSVWICTGWTWDGASWS